MSAEAISIDGRRVPIKPGQTILEVARSLNLDIPTLCYLEKCGPLNSCQVCLVKVDGKLVPSCGTKVHPGMVVESETEEVHEARRTALELLFSDHLGDCLAPCQRLCPLGLNIPLLLRQVKQNQTLQASQTVRSALPMAGVLGRLCHHPCEQGCRRGLWDSPAAIRDIERHISDTVSSPEAESRPSEHSETSSVAIVGAGPAGLACAFFLLRQGHRVTVFDRNARAGGSLLRLTSGELPAEVLEAELSRLGRMGVGFELGVELGEALSLDDLLAKFTAVVVAIGKPDEPLIGKLGLPIEAGLILAEPRSSQTVVPQVFATGAAVHATRQLVRVMAEAKATAECVHAALTGQKPLPSRKPFSSVIGRLGPGELKRFIAAAGGEINSCDRCAGFDKSQPASEAARCLHCNCDSSGKCVLQHYAQLYNADANRFRSGRRVFERQVQAGGVVFEPGKCILCGICVKLTEIAAEPLGLTFVGRGFEVRVAAPFNHAVQEGLSKTAAECVEHCPTGALSFDPERE